MQVQQQEPIIIELDDPTPRWLRVGAVLVAVLALGLMIAPWVLDVEPRVESAGTQTHRASSAGYAQVCQPSLDFPAFAQPAISVAMPSWMRICDWFADPVTQPVDLPSDAAPAPRFTD
jgi:hypothetical protein